MKILIAPDKFKGSLSAMEVCHAIGSGLTKGNPALDLVFHPMADGGDGSLEVLSGHLDLKAVEVDTIDPLGRPISSEYFTSGEVAFIELASASGLVLLSGKDRNPLKTTTAGTGKMVADAIAKGCRHIYLFLGGSSTNDAGMGIASVLGCDFLDKDDRHLHHSGQSLALVESILVKPFFDKGKIKFTLLCDVTNPLYGPDGAAFVYAPQKGANRGQVQFLDDGLRHFSRIIFSVTGKDISRVPGSGAAGGIAACLTGLFGASLKNGFATIAELTGLEEQVKSADVVITGEGKLDNQSLQGKVVGELAKLCKLHKKAFYVVVGKNDLTEKAMLSLGAKQIFTITERASDSEDAMLNAAAYLEEIGLQLAHLFHL